MNTQEVYKNVHKIQVSEEARDGILGLIDIQTNSGIQKVLDKIDANKTELESKINGLDVKIGANASKIKITNALSVCIIGGIIAGVVINFLSKK